MSVEDLGTRELGQVRSQRLDEVSFSFLSDFLCYQSLFFDFLLLSKTVYVALSRKVISLPSTHSPSRQRLYPHSTIMIEF
jgi:hypothetical protein